MSYSFQTEAVDISRVEFCTIAELTFEKIYYNWSSFESKMYFVFRLDPEDNTGRVVMKHIICLQPYYRNLACVQPLRACAIAKKCRVSCPTCCFAIAV